METQRREGVDFSVVKTVSGSDSGGSGGSEGDGDACEGLARQRMLNSSEHLDRDGSGSEEAMLCLEDGQWDSQSDLDDGDGMPEVAPDLNSASSTTASDATPGNADGPRIRRKELDESCAEARGNRHGMSKRGRPGSLGCRGVRRMTKKGGKDSNFYQTGVFMENVLVLARYTNGLEKSIEYHSVLVLTRQRVAEDDPSLEFCQRWTAALTSECASAGMTTEELGLSYRTVVSAYVFVGRQICGGTSPELDVVARARDVLLKAKADGWPALRGEWIRILAKMRGPEAAERFADEARERHEAARKGRPKDKEKQERAPRVSRSWREHLAAAARRVECALAAESRAAAEEERARRRREVREARAEEKHEDSRRNARLRWMMDRRRTMEELRVGPPTNL
mmetsp:Transcript_82678/g.267665  ORF Transcript_82678/g.267665 Transcript_82678/m.267665 type:complete len:396 (+) Transcript_82678:336-1523(+)